MINIPVNVEVLSALSLLLLLAAPGDAAFFIFDAPATAFPGSAWDGYLCEVYRPLQSGIEPALEMGTILFSETYGPWRDVLCTTPQPALGRLIYGCVSAVWDDGAGGFAASDCVTQEDFSMLGQLRTMHPEIPAMVNP